MVALVRFENIDGLYVEGCGYGFHVEEAFWEVGFGLVLGSGSGLLINANV